MNTDRQDAFAGRIEEAIRRAGGVVALAGKASVSKSAIEKWRKGGADPSLSNVLAIAAASGVDPAWLATGSAPPAAVPAKAREDFPSVPRYDVALSAGHGAFIERAEQLDSIPFTAEFFARRLGRGPKGLAIVDARGDSMEPTISDRDLVMIDTTDTQLAPAIWAFTLDDSVLVKRLQPMQAGAVQVASDNPAYAPFMIDRAESDGFHLIGRVVWVGRVL
ncbi:XRE family transcriptional regulator [Paracoccus sanguinis]|uniref:XRE family transcriptional regulator n=1 Tax=Paracoccus sanguinis TaxID=1545044 RepID=UPI00111539FE|nr:helix-turn-helix transcriptional regulator [Paracoccus sanguinis]